MWGLLWVPGFLVTRNSFKMQSRETCSGEGSLKTLLSLNKTQKSSRQAVTVFSKNQAGDCRPL